MQSLATELRSGTVTDPSQIVENGEEMLAVRLHPQVLSLFITSNCTLRFGAAGRTRHGREPSRGALPRVPAAPHCKGRAVQAETAMINFVAFLACAEIHGRIIEYYLSTWLPPGCTPTRCTQLNYGCLSLFLEVALSRKIPTSCRRLLRFCAFLDVFLTQEILEQLTQTCVPGG